MRYANTSINLVARVGALLFARLDDLSRGWVKITAALGSRLLQEVGLSRTPQITGLCLEVYSDIFKLGLYMSADPKSMSDRAHILSQIAEALAVPVETFKSDEPGSTVRHASVEECYELLEAFWQIGDRQARRRCLSYVKAAAGHSSEEA